MEGEIWKGGDGINGERMEGLHFDVFSCIVCSLSSNTFVIQTCSGRIMSEDYIFFPALNPTD